MTTVTARINKEPTSNGGDVTVAPFRLGCDSLVGPVYHQLKTNVIEQVPVTSGTQHAKRNLNPQSWIVACQMLPADMGLQKHWKMSRPPPEHEAFG